MICESVLSSLFGHYEPEILIPSETVIVDSKVGRCAERIFLVKNFRFF